MFADRPRRRAITAARVSCVKRDADQIASGMSAGSHDAGWRIRSTRE